jgi:hypothetical protein
MDAKPETNKTISGHSADIRSSDWLGSVFLISWDADPQPWENWSHPYCVIIGTEEQAKTYAKDRTEKRGGLFTVAEIRNAPALVFMPNTTDNKP